MARCRSRCTSSSACALVASALLLFACVAAQDPAPAPEIDTPDTTEEIVDAASAAGNGSWLYSQEFTYKGALSIVIMHNESDGTSIYNFALLLDGGNETRELVIAEKVKDLPPHYFSGAKATVKGRVILGTQSIRVAKLEDIEVGASSAGWAYQPERSFKVLVMYIHTECMAEYDKVSEQDVRASLDEVDRVWRQCSGGKLKLDPASKIVGPIRLPCPSSAWTNQCSENAIPGFWQGAQNWVRAMGINPNDYAYTAYVLPPSPSCYWRARAMVRCRGQDNPACFADYIGKLGIEPGILLHEWGHNIGLHHSKVWGNPYEYGDPTDPMGNAQPHCYNAPHLHQLNWLKPTVYGAAQLPPGKVRSLNVWSTSAKLRSGILVDPSGWAWTPRLFVSYLTKERGNRALPGEMANRTALHRFDAKGFIDGSAVRTEWVKSLGDGELHDFGAPLNVVVRQVRASGRRALVRVCRYAPGSTWQAQCGSIMNPAGGTNSNANNNSG